MLNMPVLLLPPAPLQLQLKWFLKGAFNGEISHFYFLPGEGSVFCKHLVKMFPCNMTLGRKEVLSESLCQVGCFQKFNN